MKADVAEGFAELDKLGWVSEVAGRRTLSGVGRCVPGRRSQKRNAAARTKRLWWSAPTHAEAARITAAIRSGLKAAGKLGDERIFAAWLPAHLTDARKRDATYYDAGDLLCIPPECARP